MRRKSEDDGLTAAPQADPPDTELDVAGEAMTSPWQGLSASFVATIGSSVLNVITGILLARALGPSDRGALAAAVLWPTIIATLGTLGIPEAVTYFAARRNHEHELVGSALTLAAMLSLAFTALGAAVLPLVLSKQDPDTVLDAYLYLPAIPLTVITLALMGVLNGRERQSWFHALRLGLLTLSAAFLVALAIGDALDVRSAVLGYLTARVLIALAAVLAVLRLEPSVRTLQRDVARGLLSYGIRSHASTVSSQLNERSDQLVISIFLAPAELGLYVVAVALLPLAYLIGTSVAYVALPIMARLEPGPVRSRRARRLVGLTLVLSAGVSIPAIPLAPAAVELLFGSAYGSVGNVARVLIVAAVVLSTNRALEGVMRGIGRPFDAGAAELVALAATFVGLALLLPTLGLMGAALASLAAYLVSGVYMVRKAVRALELSPRELLVPTREDLQWGAAQVSSRTAAAMRRP